MKWSAGGALGGTGLRTRGLVVSRDTFGERITVDTKYFCGIGEMFLMPGERFLDVESLEFSNGFVQQDLAVQHFLYQGFKFGVHLHGTG